jgi:aspartate/methionine/tyrosine aminotransferase
MDWLTGISQRPECFSGEKNKYPILAINFSSTSFCAARFKLRIPSQDADGGDSEALIRTKALENGVLALPGSVFLPNGGKTAYVRASFSLLEEEQVNEALRRLAEVIQKV